MLALPASGYQKSPGAPAARHHGPQLLLAGAKNRPARLRRANACMHSSSRQSSSRLGARKYKKIAWRRRATMGRSRCSRVPKIANECANAQNCRMQTCAWLTKLACEPVNTGCVHIKCMREPGVTCACIRDCVTNVSVSVSNRPDVLSGGRGGVC